MKLQEASFELLQFVLGQELQRGLGTFLCPPLSTNIRQRFRWICIFHHLPTFTLNDMIPVSVLCKPYLPKNWERLKCYKTTFLRLAKSQRLCVSWVNKCNIKRFCGSVLYSYTRLNPGPTKTQRSKLCRCFGLQSCFQCEVYEAVAVRFNLRILDFGFASGAGDVHLMLSLQGCN